MHLWLSLVELNIIHYQLCGRVASHFYQWPGSLSLTSPMWVHTFSVLGLSSTQTRAEECYFTGRGRHTAAGSWRPAAPIGHRVDSQDQRWFCSGGDGKRTGWGGCDWWSHGDGSGCRHRFGDRRENCLFTGYWGGNCDHTLHWKTFLFRF